MERARMSFPRGNHPLLLCEYMIGCEEVESQKSAPGKCDGKILGSKLTNES